MTVNPRGRSWQATVVHKGKRYRKDFKTKHEAEIWEAETKAQLVRTWTLSTDSGTEYPTIKEVLDDIWNGRWQGKKSDEKLLMTATIVVNALGPDRRINGITQADIDDLIRQFKKGGNSNSTINRKLSALSVILNRARKVYHLTTLPTIERLKENENRIRVVSVEEERLMLTWAAMKGDRDFMDYMIVSIDTGLRQGEVLRLEARDITPLAVTVWVSKGGKPRTVPLTARASEVLLRRAEGAKKVFAALTPRMIIDRWHKMAKDIGIPEDDEQFVPHAMRHTFCTRLADADVDAATIKELAGHSTIVTTQRYIHVNARRLRTAIDRLMNPMPHVAGVAQNHATPHPANTFATSDAHVTH